MSHRKEQVESLLKRAVASVLQRGLADPRIKGLVSVTKVDVSPDLRNAAVYISITPEQYESRTLHGLKDATRHIQKQVNKAVKLRLVPHLEFRLDKGLKKQAEVFAAINEAMRRTEQTNPGGTDAAGDQATDQAGPEPDGNTADHPTGED